MILHFLPPENEMEALGAQMRDFAVKNPLHRVPSMAQAVCYTHNLAENKYNCSVMLECYYKNKPPVWHALVCILHEVSRGTDYNFGIPTEALIAVAQWPEDERKIAKEILGYLLGPVIKASDQRVTMIDGVFSHHWFTESNIAENLGLNHA